MTRLPECPSLPPFREGMDCGELSRHGCERGAAFYESCLLYAQHLWCRGLPARALLCLDRAMGADLGAGEPILASWPIPYAAVEWIMRHTPEGVFIGNPRVHFQHYADRMNEPRRELRRWRAWACWSLACLQTDVWPADPLHLVEEPKVETIFEKLQFHGSTVEANSWRLLINVIQ